MHPFDAFQNATDVEDHRTYDHAALSQIVDVCLTQRAAAPGDDEHQADDLLSADEQPVITVPVPADQEVGSDAAPPAVPCNPRARAGGQRGDP
ncbi:hypothetical protein GCM10023317_88060 [Actinopolymorpha pittospori]